MLGQNRSTNSAPRNHPPSPNTIGPAERIHAPVLRPVPPRRRIRIANTTSQITANKATPTINARRSLAIAACVVAVVKLTSFGV